ncbi:chloride channel protein [Amycolatopsis thermophila]|uniref:H+/Cl- antiporter ClcA n=1 Tax=Amycolatopsis thermophila TaxID=206084 RepID=A0ABU0F0Q6_9PSEU|nr:chloride channel protein [Amycolatopsis thermophila]MDQ0381152.1 H+/Cl- antiporter ClcA [Amycolatopsis thermophila]
MLPPHTLLLAAIAGALGAAGAVGLIRSVAVLRGLLAGAPAVVLLLAPVVAGLCCGPLVAALATGAGGVVAVRDALAAGEPLPARAAAIKGVAAVLTLGSGGSGGSEGPIIHLAAALGSALAPAASVRAVMAGAVAGGFAGSFQAPWAGVAVVAEVLLARMSWAEVAAVVVGATAGTATARALPFAPLRLPSGTAGMLTVLPVALLAGLAGVALVWCLRQARRAADAVWHRPEWARPIVGGLLVGAAVVAVPGAGGIGQDVIAAAGTAGATLLLPVAKIAATSVTLAVGGVAGTIGPALVTGATVGAAVAGPGGAAVGLAACLAAGARAPVTAAVLAAELTGVTALPAVLPAAVLGWAVGLLWCPGTLFEPGKVERS